MFVAVETGQVQLKEVIHQRQPTNDPAIANFY